MGEDERRLWFHAAYLALEGYPADLIRDGAREAMLTADHPSKIVPAIVKAVGQRWINRQALEDRSAATWLALQEQAAKNATLHLPQNEEEGETTAEILKRVWPTMDQHVPGYKGEALNLNPDRECRKPTREDYIRLGVDPAVLDQMEP
jgi:hypothetical protein